MIGLLRLQQPQPFRKHIAFGEKPPLGNQSLYERCQVGRDVDGHGLRCSASWLCGPLAKAK
jgi:hypothetical protein